LDLPIQHAQPREPGSKRKSRKRVRNILPRTSLQKGANHVGKAKQEQEPELPTKSILKKKPAPAHANIHFNDQVQVVTTFKKSEYPRKPDNTATFRNLTPVLKMQIREELNNFKASEMTVAPESQGNTCFH
jgi:hypothetical protein